MLTPICLKKYIHLGQGLVNRGHRTTFKIVIHVILYGDVVPEYTYTYHVGADRGQKRALEPVELVTVAVPM